jgi:hypothetical protein
MNLTKLADDLDVLDVSQLSDFDRIRRIRTTLNEFLNTQLIKEISKEPEVRPPLTQTNLLKKNPNFKKVVELWNFLDSYKRKGFEVVIQRQNDRYCSAGCLLCDGIPAFYDVYCYKPGTSFNP